MAKQTITDVTEQKRLKDAREAGIPWKKWISSRENGTGSHLNGLLPK